MAHHSIAMTNLPQYGNPELNGGGGWGIFNAILGWQNSATYGSVISYNCYWVAVILGFVLMRYKETKGHWPLMKTKVPEERVDSVGLSPINSGVFERGEGEEKVQEEVQSYPVPARTLSEE